MRERATIYERYVKRALDVSLSGAALVALSPLMLATAAAVKLDSKGPVLFCQQRLGLHGGPFTMYKFRSMTDGAEHTGSGVYSEQGDPRVTKVGRVIRAASIDELPQLLNILAGDMSVIGPRPALWNQEDLFQERERYGANDVRPGLTGWAQIHGRDELEIPEKARLDGEYVEHLSFSFDCKCFFGTIGKVLRQEGVVEGGTGVLQKQ